MFPKILPAHLIIFEMLSNDGHERVKIHELGHVLHGQVPLEVDEEQEGSDIMG